MAVTNRLPELTSEQKEPCPVGQLLGRNSIEDLTEERLVSAACRRKYARLVSFYGRLRSEERL